MLFKSAIIFTFALCMASHDLGAAIETPTEIDSPVHAFIATDPYYACNCPNNCRHKVGTGCKFYSGPSDTSGIINGKCASRDGTLTCVAN
ncbi:hypothetical protein QBC32DRAFT_316262 [Pseudoneurospora amorphoporcata]|uniref:Secreted protein n=1 Tax=Pseudoneurospora amorphoporcata TaxID=241081 RepID=A0AAN6NQ42_9PEZI|nr:hypothetical protein QBC32DRAFT_316262 [Pseudoneurospora amorphoporcata]